VSVNRTVLLECDHDEPGKICRASFTVGTTVLRITRDAAYEEGWSVGSGTDPGPDFCPRHLPPWDSRR